MAYGGIDDGLFRGAILQSGGAFPLTAPSTTAFQSTFDSLITNTTCNSFANSSAAKKLECIRALPLETFRSNVGRSTGQSVDGDFIRTSIQRALPAGDYIKVATIVGCMSSTDRPEDPRLTQDQRTLTKEPHPLRPESTQQRIFWTQSVSHVTDLSQRVCSPAHTNIARGFFRPQRLPNDTVSTIIDLYPENPRLGCPYNTGDIRLSPGELDKKACSIFGDIVQIGPARMITQNLARDGVKVYRYRFNHLKFNTSTVNKGIGTGAELPYMFSNGVPDYAWDQNLAFQMTASWASFAYDLDPNIGAIGKYLFLRNV
jgi:carboxylesterase type B